MSDVFISYAREDRAAAQALAAALQARGLDVWWDRVIPPGRQFDEVIEEQLDAARCAVVLWSAAAAASKWVKAEAGEALQQDKLVPALLAADLKLPLEFRRVQAADLSGWQPGQPAAALDQFCTDVAAAVAAAASRAPGSPRPPSPPPPPRRQRAGAAAVAAGVASAPAASAAPARRKTWAWVAAGVIGVGGVASLMESPQAPAPPPQASPRVTTPATSQDVPAISPAPPAPAPAAGLDVNLAWRDYLFAYQGRLQWDGRQSVATVDLQAQDSGSGLVVSQGRVQALLMPNTAPMLVFYVKVPVPQGDSRTMGPHVHENHLIFQRGAGGGWVFARNCRATNPPLDCYP